MISLQKHYGHLLRILHWCSDQTMTTALEAMDLTAAQGHIIGFLCHRREPPCPRDLETAFQLSHPTVSGLLNRLEKKGFLELRPDENDRRCKRIYVSSKGWECHETIRKTILSNENRMVQDFTEEERAQFRNLLTRAITNMGGNPSHPKHKEEETQ